MRGLVCDSVCTDGWLAGCVRVGLSVCLSMQHVSMSMSVPSSLNGANNTCDPFGLPQCPYDVFYGGGFPRPRFFLWGLLFLALQR